MFPCLTVICRKQLQVWLNASVGLSVWITVQCSNEQLLQHSYIEYFFFCLCSKVKRITRSLNHNYSLELQSLSLIPLLNCWTFDLFGLLCCWLGLLCFWMFIKFHFLAPLLRSSPLNRATFSKREPRQEEESMWGMMCGRGDHSWSNSHSAMHNIVLLLQLHTRQ